MSGPVKRTACREDVNRPAPEPAHLRQRGKRPDPLLIGSEWECHFITQLQY
jgi:hypothetical protein